MVCISFTSGFHLVQRQRDICGLSWHSISECGRRMLLTSNQDLIGFLFHHQLLYLFWKPFKEIFVILLNNILGNCKKYCSNIRQNCFNAEGHQPTGIGCPETLPSFHLWRYSKLTGQGPWQPALADPALFRSIEQVISRDPFQPQLFCDSVTSSPELSRLH